MATADSTWSAVCVLPGAFNEAEDAVTVNGVPLYALNIPFSCQPPAWRLPPLGPAACLYRTALRQPGITEGRHLGHRLQQSRSLGGVQATCDASPN